MELIRNDLRFLYTILLCRQDQIKTNYNVFMLPYMGMIIDGAEDWLTRYNKSSSRKLNVPLFSEDEAVYYSELRNSIKIFDSSYVDLRALLESAYNKSEYYFSNECAKVAKRLKLYNVYGADLVNQTFCGNTILCNIFTPRYEFGKEMAEIKQYSVIAGQYISLFNAIDTYSVDTSMTFTIKDFSPVFSPTGMEFNDNFVLFSILCQINFVLICVDQFILEECSTKVRLTYMLYYYLCNLVSEINSSLQTAFSLDGSYYNSRFRNAMAHYGLGMELKESDIIENDMLFGLTQIYFHCNSDELKNDLIQFLQILASQIKNYIKI